MELLIFLIQRRGELVSREEIAGRLWGKDVFLDVDHSINTAVRKIRLVLRDDPDKPRFIETVVGKGYRFSAPVLTENGNSSIQAQPLLVPSQAPSIAEDRAAEKNASSVWLKLVILALVMAVAGIGVVVWLDRTEYLWRNPIASARFQTITDFDGIAQNAAVSRDGHFVAFLSDRDGQMDVWVTQLGSGQFHNLTQGTASEIVNPSIRTLGFSPDGSLVTFWTRKPDASNGADINVWAVPTLGGGARPYLEGVAEFDWSHDGSRLAYHTAGPGDPLFVSDGKVLAGTKPIFAAAAGLHGHFPVWSPDSGFIYFVQGSLPDKLDIWRIRPSGGTPERITSHSANVTYPILLSRRLLVYLARDPDGSGPWLYGMDVERRVPHRLTSGPDRYTSLAASGDGRRLVATIARTKKTLWSLANIRSRAAAPTPAQISLPTGAGFSPRLGPNYLLYVSAADSSESIWKLANGTSTQLWIEEGARIFGGPAISHDGANIAFSVRRGSRASLYVMRADGTNARIVNDKLDLQGDPAWEPDGKSITSSASDRGGPHLFRIPLDGRSPVPFIEEYSLDPAWTPDGNLAVYSGPDIGTSFSLKAVLSNASPRPLPFSSVLTRGPHHLAFLPKGRKLVMLRGPIEHKDLWLLDLDTGAEQPLTSLPPDFDVADFDISPDGSEIVLQRMQEHSDVVLLDLPRQ